MIVVFGSINLDLIFALPHLPEAGETVLTRAVRMEPGGKGANQAIAAARSGARVILAGAVGRDALAAQALAGLQAAGVDLTRVTETDLTTGCAAITHDRRGENAIAVGSGANLLAGHEQVEDALLGPDTTLLLQNENDPEQAAALIRRATARGARTILNLAPAGPIAADALRALNLLIVNSREAEWLGPRLGTGVNASSLRAALGVDVIRTMGGEGAEIATIAEHQMIASFPVEPLDTTAAGDAFVGVLAAELDLGATMRNALHRASVGAALACTRLGSQSSIPRRSDIDIAIRDRRSSRPAAGERPGASS